MDELEKNIPDTFWKKSFDEATETPAPRVWSAIERRLDAAEGPKIIPLWGLGLMSSRSLAWGVGIAAALALLMVGRWAVNLQAVRPSVAHQQSATPHTSRAAKSNAPNKSLTPKLDQPGDAVASVAMPLATGKRTTIPSKQVEFNFPAGPTPDVQVQLIETAKASLIAVTAERPASAGIQLSASSASQRMVASFTVDNPNGYEGLNRRAMVLEPLLGKPLRMQSFGTIQRIVWLRPAESSSAEPVMEKESLRKRDRWASVSVMPGAFNPSVSVAQAQPTFANSAIAYDHTGKSLAVDSRTSFSVTYQASAGVQLTDRWSVESGVGYLAGRSTIDAPAQQTAPAYAQVANTNRTAVNNLYVDALRKGSAAQPTNNFQSAVQDKLALNNAYLSQVNYSGQTRQTLDNDYQYVQVPVQVGYQLRPRKRLSLAVLGGFITNIFVKNTVGNNELVITPKDDVYKPVALAATMGARLRYRPSDRWSASLAGVYQPSIGSGTQADSPVQTRPTSSGMSFGVDYHFK